MSTATKERTLQQVLDESEPLEVAPSLRKVLLATTFKPLKRTFSGLASGASFDLTAIDGTGETVGPANVNRIAALIVKGLRIGDAVKARLDLATKTAHVDIIIAAKTAGTGGNAITIAFVADAGAGAGSITEVGNVITVHYKDAVSTVADIRALLATSTLIDLVTNGTGATVLHDPADTFGAANLAGGQADTGAAIVSDVGATMITPTDTKVGIARISDDGKTITFAAACTGFTIEYMPRTLQVSDWTAAFAPAPDVSSVVIGSPNYSGPLTDSDTGFL